MSVGLERFKTQILLLHSEQSALDSLSAGFSERYTVHCATTGSEALTTLGETQIDVIVSAQRLPGMSGLDALREAKKRSPDTIGILLAGNDDEGLEALVGDQEVFQIIRGSVTPDALKSLVDSVTQQTRLMALAESANDIAANPDELSGEHIVMETSENGSTIISDGTGRFPALNPQKVSAAADVGARSVDVLVLTQDEEFLGTVRESARGLHNVIYANTLQQADEAVRKHKVGVAVVDAAMVGSNVEKLTLHLRNTVPRLVAIVAGRRDDGEMLMDLINRGKVYRFLLKPVSPGRARLAIEASVKHHLEAPDSAFIRVGSVAPAKTAPAPKPKAQPKPEPRPAPAKPVAKPAPAKPARHEPRPATAPKAGKEAPGKRPGNAAPAADGGVSMTARRDDALSPTDDGLSSAFGGDDKSFTETMTGIMDAVRKPFSRNVDAEPATPKTQPAPGSGGSKFGKLRLLGIGAAVIAVLASAGLWYFNTPDSPEPVADPVATAPAIDDADGVLDSEAVMDTTSPAYDLLEQARLAADAGQVYDPPGNNAIELYVAAMAAAPGDATAEAEFNAMIEQALTMAESALLERRIVDVSAALDRVAAADPDNSRLPFLATQLSQLQLREFLDGARAAIRDGRYENASASLDSARNLAVGDASEIDLVADELAAALGAQEVDGLLAKGAVRLEEGKLIAPSNDNARYYYELALSNDPGNAVARQGLTTVASKLVLQARAEIDAGNLSFAEDLIADARRLDPSSDEVAAAISAVQAARDRQEQERIAAQQREREAQEAAERAAAERAAAEQAAAERAAAEQAAAERAAAERAAAERAAAEQAAAERAASERAAAEQATAEPEEPPVAMAVQGEDSTPQQAAGQSGPAADAVVAGPAAREAGSAMPPADTQPVSVSSLDRIKYVAPKYPRSAQRRSVSGWVDVVFTVGIDGTVSNIEVRDSNPGDLFVSSATKAVEGWEFEPIIEDGVAVSKRAAVRLMFAIE
ncbi:MAG TPA: TonB family protein [Woeseiaceae bacterium]|jgi:TonB family protein|nr:TonB family protein [Woeseiaceae bacterium]